MPQLPDVEDRILFLTQRRTFKSKPSVPQLVGYLLETTPPLSARQQHTARGGPDVGVGCQGFGQGSGVNVGAGGDVVARGVVKEVEEDNVVVVAVRDQHSLQWARRHRLHV